jgi:hypothetical protein
MPKSTPHCNVVTTHKLECLGFVRRVAVWLQPLHHPRSRKPRSRKLQSIYWKQVQTQKRLAGTATWSFEAFEDSYTLKDSLIRIFETSPTFRRSSVVTCAVVCPFVRELAPIWDSSSSGGRIDRLNICRTHAPCHNHGERISNLFNLSQTIKHVS